MLLLPMWIALSQALTQSAGVHDTSTTVQDNKVVVCREGQRCVNQDDLDVMLESLRFQHCRITQDPIIEADPIRVSIDKANRIYGDKSLSIKVHWCEQELHGSAPLTITEALSKTNSPWILTVRAVVGWRGELDGGLAVEPFQIGPWGLDGYIGVRSIGGGVGFSITPQLGLMALWGVEWNGGTGPMLGVSWKL